MKILQRLRKTTPTIFMQLELGCEGAQGLCKIIKIVTGFAFG